MLGALAVLNILDGRLTHLTILNIVKLVLWVLCFCLNNRKFITKDDI